jgi:ubiquinone/menaquinone biosynthesis C-methylase UbiE
MSNKTLDSRHESEKRFHDKKFSDRNTSIYSIGFMSSMFNDVMDKIGDLEGQNVLETGCGSGWFTKILAKKGANIWAFDISAEAVNVTKTLMHELGYDNSVKIDQMPAENMSYEPEMFDLVIGNAILHHLDLNLAVGEIFRVLKKGGKALFMEPLGHNQLINFYRRLTPHLRSKDERPLEFNQFDLFYNSFNRFEHHEYYFLSCFALVFYFLRMIPIVAKTRDRLEVLDKILIEKYGILRKYCWYTVLIMEK